LARKFIGKKEIAFFNAINRELIRDVVGQTVTYYQVLAEKTRANDLYNEAIQKVFAQPINISALVSFENTQEKIGTMPADSQYKLDVLFHNHELRDLNVAPKMGDFIQFGDIMFEIYSVSQPQLTYGMIENRVMTKCNCGPARKGQMAAVKQPMPTTRNDLNAPMYPMQPKGNK
jgi:hypothetical protein